MRLGGRIFKEYSDPVSWVKAVKSYGYSAAYCPVKSDANDTIIQSYVDAAKDADIVIAEVGAWSNILSSDEEERLKAIRFNQEQLELADKIGARCCVNIGGSRSQYWAGHHPDNLTKKTFNLLVETIQTIIDAVQPTHTFYTIECMPWQYPDSADSYLRLIKAANRKQFAAHFDPANWISSPQLYYHNGELIHDCCVKLGSYIRSCHAKDIIMDMPVMYNPVHLHEIRPGLGGLDYRVYLSELSKLDQDTPLMLEHLDYYDDVENQYRLAADYIRSVAKANGLHILQ